MNQFFVLQIQQTANALFGLLHLLKRYNRLNNVFKILKYYIKLNFHYEAVNDKTWGFNTSLTFLI
jgi:hypothetical protein